MTQTRSYCFWGSPCTPPGDESHVSLNDHSSPTTFNQQTPPAAVAGGDDDYLQALHRRQVAELLRRPGDGSGGTLDDAVLVLQDGLGAQGCPRVEELVGDHGSDRGFARVGHRSTVILALGSLAGPHSLSHLRHHREDTCRKLLMAQVRQSKLLLLRIFG